MENRKSIIIVLFAPAILVMAFAIFWSVTTPKTDSVSNSPLFHQEGHKVWAHRGYLIGDHEIAENSIEAYNNALTNGAKGIEIDIYFNVREKQFLVSHDEPNTEKLTLDTVIAEFGDSSYYWLDFKNLLGLNQQETEEAAQTLYEILEGANIIASTLIESQSAENLHPFQQKGMHVSYWVFSHPDFSLLQYWKNIFTIRYTIYKYNIPALSMDYRGFTPKFREFFPAMNYYLFTVNDEDVIHDLGAMSEVQVILTDENFFGFEWQ